LPTRDSRRSLREKQYPREDEEANVYRKARRVYLPLELLVNPLEPGIPREVVGDQIDEDPKGDPVVEVGARYYARQEACHDSQSHPEPI
jgi:hypothetical protein